MISSTLLLLCGSLFLFWLHSLSLCSLIVLVMTPTSWTIMLPKVDENNLSVLFFFSSWRSEGEGTPLQLMPRCFLFDIEPSKTYTAFTAWVGNRIKNKKTPAQARTYAIICCALLWLLFHARHFVLLFPTFDTFAVLFVFFNLLGTVRSTFRITSFPYSIYIRLCCLYFFETHIPWSIFFCSL